MRCRQHSLYDINLFFQPIKSIWYNQNSIILLYKEKALTSPWVSLVNRWKKSELAGSNNSVQSSSNHSLLSPPQSRPKIQIINWSFFHTCLFLDLSIKFLKYFLVCRCLFICFSCYDRYIYFFKFWKTVFCFFCFLLFFWLF